MNRNSPYQSIGTISNAGTVAQLVPLASVDPSVVGKLLRLKVEMSNGSTTTATIELVDSTSGAVFGKWPDFTLNLSTPIDVADVPLPWQVAAPSDLQVKITTDDPANGTTVAVKVTGEAV